MFFGIHENRIHPRYSESILAYFRYIDDYIGVWVPHESDQRDTYLWHQFQSEMNDYHGLQWEFSERINSVNYMDLTITLTNGTIETNMYEKQLNLYPYIPPLSAHPPGVITGLVLGNSYRIITLVTKAVDRKGHFHNFYNRLLHRGYQPATIKPLFQRTVVQQQTRLLAQQNSPQPSLPPTKTHLELVYYHVQYHLHDPPSHDIQLL